MAKFLDKWKPEGLRLEFAWVGNGVLLHTCNATNCSVPLGSVWVILTSNDFGEAICEIVDIYVPEKFRRKGVGTFMMRSMQDAYGMLRTGTGTRAGGMQLMKSMGWRQNRQTGDWYLRGDVKRIGRK